MRGVWPEATELRPQRPVVVVVAGVVPVRKEVVGVVPVVGEVLPARDLQQEELAVLLELEVLRVVRDVLSH